MSVQCSQKIDVEVDDIFPTSDQDEDHHRPFRVGEHVHIRPNESENDKYIIEYADGTAIAWVHREKLPHHVDAQSTSLPWFSAHIKSIKRDTVTKNPISILLRITGELDEPKSTLLRENYLLKKDIETGCDNDGTLHDEDPAVATRAFQKLCQNQFEQLAENEEIRWFLRDEKLQSVLVDIDSAEEREKALVEAMKSPIFEEFAGKVLDVVSPPQAPS